MRLWAVLNALVFRGTSRIVPGSDEELRVRLGVKSLLRLFRPEIQLNILPKALGDWPRFVAGWQRGGPDENMLSKIWMNTRGGVGARDVWDLTRAIAGRPETADSFVAVAALSSIALLAIGGRYGESVGAALKRAMERHLPEAIVSADQLQSVADAYVVGAELPIDELARRYLMQLALGVGIDTSALYAGVINHFLRWCGEASERIEATYQEAVQEMKARVELARKYLASCEETDKVRVEHGGKDEESVVSLSVTGNRRGQNAKINGGVVVMASYAESLWERSVQLCEE